MLKVNDKMRYKSLRYEGSIEDLLTKLLYQWKATGEFALCLLGINDRAKPADYWIYVRQKDFDTVVGYLASSGASQTRIMPNLRVEGIKRLPPSAEKNPYVPKGHFLAKDARRTLSPRLLEAQPTLLELLKRVS